MTPAKMKYAHIDNATAEILRRQVECDGNELRIVGARLDPATYRKVNGVLEILGGRWSRKTQSHVFSSPPGDVIAAALSDGKVINAKQSYQFFETPRDVAEQMVCLARIRDKMRVLEPSAGNGAIVSVIRRSHPDSEIWAVEIDSSRGDSIRDSRADGIVISDFLAAGLPDLGGRDLGFDRVIMNPPFSSGQDADHVRHAFELLKPGGQLVSVISEGICTRSDRKSREFAEFVQEHIVNEIKLDAGAFKASGTLVPTRIIVLVKPSEGRV